MKKLFIIFVIVFFAVPALSEYLTPPTAGKPENHFIKQPRQKKQSRARQTIPRYNPHERTWQMAPKKNVLKYNPFAKKYEFADPQGELKYNPFTREHEYER